MDLVLISSNSFSKVYRLESPSGGTFYLKHFNYPQKCTINGFNLSPIYKRDRLKVSYHYFQLFSKSKFFNEYLDGSCVVLPELNLLIIESGVKDYRSFDDILAGKEQSVDWSIPVTRFSIMLKKHQLRAKKQRNLFNNDSVINLKFELQLVKPLQKLLKKEKVEEIVSKIGALDYVNHGDVQPKNMLLGENGLNLIDFEEGFVGPQGWDLGFLWGNIIYLSVVRKKNFNLAKESWAKLFREEKNFDLKHNIIVFTVSTILMRIYYFPLLRVNDSDVDILLSLVKSMLSEIGYE